MEKWYKNKTIPRPSKEFVGEMIVKEIRINYTTNETVFLTENPMDGSVEIDESELVDFS